MPNALDRVRKYYDDNTAAFERFGQGQATIHRAVWGPGVHTREAAFAYLDHRIEAELERRFGPERALRVLDLGCGLGASLMRLASRPKLTGVGVTISPVQVARATALIEQAGLAERLRVLEHSFTDLPDSLGIFDVAIAIESFVHSPSPEAFFDQAARRLSDGGVLIVVDDFLTSAGARTRRSSERRLLEDFRNCWLASSAISHKQAMDIAAARGLYNAHDEDLTAYLELRRPRDLAITALVELGGWLPIPGERWRAWKGGDALQRALDKGLVAFRLLVFEKRMAA